MESDEVSEKKLKEECYICGHLCHPKRMLTHIRSHTNVEIHECDVCGDRFSSKSTLQKHYISHKTHYICQHCNKKFVDPDYLKSHICFDSDEGYTCETCGKEFHQKSRLMRHITSHSKDKPFKCEICNKTFRFKSSLTAHSSSKHYINENGEYVSLPKDTVYECHVCNQEFFTQKNLEKHYLSHNDAKPYSCEVCNRAFSLKHNMEVHMRLHYVRDKLFQCMKCDKCFNRRSNLKVHYAMHLRKELGLPAPKQYNGKNFTCDICNKSFISKRNLNQHQVTHTKEKPFACQFCNQRFSYDSCLKRHSYVHTEGAFRKRPPYQKYKPNGDEITPYVCNICREGFVSEKDLISHKKDFLQPKNYKCCNCFQIFKIKKKYNEHEKVHDDALTTVPVVCELKVVKEEPIDSE